MSFLVTLSSAILGCLFVALCILKHIYLDNDEKPHFYGLIIPPLLILSLSFVCHTLYQVVRLRISTKQIGNIDDPLLELIRKFTNLCTLYTLNWCMISIAIPLFDGLQLFRVPAISTSFPSILFVNTLITLGLQCKHFSHCLKHYDDEIRRTGTVSTFHGLSYIIFTTAMYGAVSLGLSVWTMTDLNQKWSNLAVFDFAICTLCPAASLTLLLYCHHFNGVVVTFVSELSSHSTSVSESRTTSVHEVERVSGLGSVHIHSSVNTNGSYTSYSPRCSLRTICSRHSLYIHNGIPILFNFATLLGSVVFDVVDMSTIRVLCVVMVVISGGSMLVHFLKRHCMTMLVGDDNKYRVCCVQQTCSLMLIVVLIDETDDNEYPTWRMTYGALAVLNILSITILTTRYDRKFWDRLNSLRYYHKFGKLPYWTYCISLLTTNGFLLYMIGNALFHPTKFSDFQLSHPKLSLFSIFPFVWIVCAVLYHNEFARFQQDFRKRTDSIWEYEERFVASSMRSLYYFMNLTVITSFGTMVVYAVYISGFGINSDQYDSYMIGYMVFTCVTFLNGVVALFVLDDIKNDVFLQNELTPQLIP